MLPGTLKKLPNWAQQGHPGAKMANLERNLLPTWFILRSSWTHLREKSRPNEPEISRSAPRHPKTTQGGARDLHDSPWSLIFAWFRGRFRTSFSISSAVSPAICYQHASWYLICFIIRFPTLHTNKNILYMAESSANTDCETEKNGSAARLARRLNQE